MDDLSTIEQFLGIIRGMLTIFFGAILFASIKQLYLIITRGWPRRPPDGTVPGFIEEEKRSTESKRDEITSGLVSAPLALTGGMGAYFLFSGAMLVYIFFDVLWTGQTSSHYEMLYLAAGGSIVVTVYLQNTITSRIKNSQWVRGF